VWLLGTGLYFNVAFSPSPVSTVFWLAKPEWLSWKFHVAAYRVTEREREIRWALARYVPSDPAVSVSSQNNVNSSHLAHRRTFRQFPAEAAFVVVDVRRPLFLADRIDPEAFMANLDQIRLRQKILYQSDGFVIFGPSPP
jgi:hypothetical protein